ncbi:MAG TPA: trypsin-like peptidase domain-containing protein, partial [Roseiflexaceae bacterium]|nr:trypsin-like peptidase domain-containing protein [Roseiflexaceae bacterium]
MFRSTRAIVIGAMAIALLIGATVGAIAGGSAAFLIARQRSAQAAQTQVLPVRSVDTQAAPAPQSAPQAAPQPTAVPQAPLPQPGDQPVVAVVKRAAPAVVTVINTLGADAADQSNPFSVPGQAQRASGSGVIFNDQGYIITNNHVVEGEQALAVVFADGSRTDATLVGTDPLNDLAVIKVEGKVPGWLPLGDSSALQPGETVIAIGSPLGNFKNTVTVGVVSALNRSVGDSPEGLIQTDAAINSGNSGGPLINLKGEVIGINTLVVRTQGTSAAPVEGLGFSIPSNTVKTVAEQLVANGKVEHPFLGVTYTQIDPDLAATENLPSQQGALLREIQSNGPAARAGLQAGDIVLGINGTQLDNSTSLRSLLMQYHPGDTIDLTVLRDGRQITLNLTLGV